MLFVITLFYIERLITLISESVDTLIKVGRGLLDIFWDWKQGKEVILRDDTVDGDPKRDSKVLAKTALRNTIATWHFLHNLYYYGKRSLWVILRLERREKVASRSSASHTFLTKTDSHSEGHYACEVSAEWPLFGTVRAERQMKVYVLPREGLTIEGGELSYSTGDLINVTCTASPSSPPQTLDWYINDVKASEDQLVKYSPNIDNQNELVSERLGLLFQSTENYFVRGSLKLTCTSSIILVYRYEASITLSGGTPKNNTLNGHSFTSREDRLNQPELETPIIDGVMDKYQVGSLMDLNCSTKSEADLRWFIKNKEATETQLIRFTHPNGRLLKLGLRFEMENRHFQMQELRLRCVAFYRTIVANFSKSLIIRTYGQDEPLVVQSGLDYGNNSVKETSSSVVILFSLSILNLITFHYSRR